MKDVVGLLRAHHARSVIDPESETRDLDSVDGKSGRGHQRGGELDLFLDVEAIFFADFLEHRDEVLMEGVLVEHRAG